MKGHADSVISYVLGVGFMLYSGVLANADAIMTFGGLILLAARLYVDGGKAVKTWRARNGRR
ncbi:hypothetical protein [Rhizobium phage RHph_X3_9]|nr:hypothetical protein [Rhizobium phage RHph_X3_9]